MSTVTDTTIASSPAVVEYKLIIEKSLKGNEDAITQKFTDELQKPEIEDKAIKDIRNLTKTIKEIKAGFERIAGSFVEFDGANFKDKDDNVLKLGPSWEDFYKRFTLILEQSHQNAIAATAFMTQYSDALLTDIDQSSFGDLQKELDAFAKALEPKAADALQSQNDFSNLAKDVRLFVPVIEDAIRKAGGRIADDLVAARLHLDTLQSQLAEVTDKMKSLGIACVSTIAVGAVSAGIAFFTLSPVALFTAVTSFISAIGTGIEYAEAEKEAARLESEIQKCNNQIAELMAQEELLKKYQQSLLATTKEEIYGLAGKIDVITGIWQYLKSDMLLLKGQLDLIAAPDMPITGRFLKKIAATRALYVKLAKLLDMYAKGTESEE